LESKTKQDAELKNKPTTEEQICTEQCTPYPNFGQVHAGGLAHLGPVHLHCILMGIKKE
jgi:hypothetical protein